MYEISGPELQRIIDKVQRRQDKGVYDTTLETDVIAIILLELRARREHMPGYRWTTQRGLMFSPKE